MSHPRRVCPGMTVMITRRTLRRTHLLRPDARLNEMYHYYLAVIAARHGIQVHAAMLMSTHEHLIVTDRLGRLPLFLRELHRMVALGVKILRRWEGAVWDHEKTSVVELCTRQAVIEKLAYVIANPVSARLVRRASEWPGVGTLPGQLGTGQVRASRPDFYVDPENPRWPQTAVLHLSIPPLCSNAEDLQRNVILELKRLERTINVHSRANSWRIAGSARVLHSSPYKRSMSWEPFRSLNPHIAAGRGQQSAYIKAIQTLKGFRRAYRVALDAWRRGDRKIAFPAGTWLMQVLHSALIETG